jgi:flagellar basal-body rod protein FlgC
VPGIGGVPSLFRGLAISASGLSAQRRRMDVIATNIANAETTRTPDGGPYRRRILELAEAQSPYEVRAALAQNGLSIEVPEVPEVPIPGETYAALERAYGVEVLGIVEDASEGPLVYEPGHPDADEAGYVRYPNVDITEETIDLMETRRVYEANATVFDAMKSMLRRATQI